MDYAEFGRYLTQQRELRGMAREEVSRLTRIPGTLVAALEAGEVEKLPGRVFVLNYIRAYAQVIGVSPEEALLRFQEVDQTLKSAPPPQALERDRRRRALWRLGVVALLVLAGVGALAFERGWLRAAGH